MTNSAHSSSQAKILKKLYGYPRAVLDGRVMACEKARMACERFERELARSRSDPAWRWHFDEGLAARPIEFMERFLQPTKGNYGRMELMPWQCFVEGNLYGWVDRKSGLRRFREGLVVVGRGNGKSTLMAGNAAFGASKDGERGADVYLLANSKDQAGIVFTECRDQIRASPTLTKHFRTLRDVIHYDATNSKIVHRASDSRKLDGLNPHIAIFDEIHEYRNYKLINVIKRGMNKRRQPLALYITTMGEVLDGPLMDYYGLFTDAMTEGILPPETADRMFCYICELDPADSIEDTALWAKANPGMGVLLDGEQLALDWARCKNVPSEKGDFITKQLNVMADMSDTAYLDIGVIQRNEDVIPLEALTGRACYGGVDLSSREDFTAAALEFPLDDGRVFVLQHSWIPQRKTELDNEKINYHEWAMLGHLTIVPGDYVNQDAVYQWFVRQARKYEILTIGYDPANAHWLTRALEAHGFACEVVRQGPLTLNDPMKDIREMMLAGRVVSNKDPLLRWYSHNVRLRNDYRDRAKENWMPVKRSRYRKIDGFAAWLDAHCVAMRKEPVAGESTEAGITIYTL